MNRASLIGLLAITLLCNSCGVYTFNPAGKSDIQSVAVLRFQNETAELGLEDRLTDGVIDAFIDDGSLKVLPPDAADAVLEGSLVNYTRAPHQFTTEGTEEVESYAVTMDFAITLKNPDDDSEMWTERMRQTGIYDVIDETEEDAQQEAIRFLVEAILNRTIKSW